MDNWTWVTGVIHRVILKKFTEILHLNGKSTQQSVCLYVRTKRYHFRLSNAYGITAGNSIDQ